MAIPSFHTLTIREIRPETADSISVAFEVPKALREAYRFRAGQFLTLRASVDHEALRRSYSVCVGEPDYEATGELRVAIKQVAQGRFSRWAHQTLAAGQSIDVMTPDGRFGVEALADSSRHHVGFAGGSGITPMLSLIRTLLAAEPASRFTLVYGNRTVESIMFLEALAALKNQYIGRLALIHVLSGEPGEIDLLSGRLDLARCRELLRTLISPKSIDEAFVCGPAPMMDAVEASLREAGVAAEKIHIERFGTPGPAASIGAVEPSSMRSTQAPPGAHTGEAIGATVMIIADGKTRQLRIASDGPSILDAGLAAGANLPYACKAAVCCTCRARVLEGEVRMDRNYTLEPPEIARGFVLTCQSHPVSDRVVISFDER
ncbi:MAG: 1,2-phenylacetyl-CoA epoxidase subunit PaaE [Burkholderiales bacterium]